MTHRETYTCSLGDREYVMEFHVYYTDELIVSFDKIPAKCVNRVILQQYLPMRSIRPPIGGYLIKSPGKWLRLLRIMFITHIKYMYKVIIQLLFVVDLWLKTMGFYHN